MRTYRYSLKAPMIALPLLVAFAVLCALIDYLYIAYLWIFIASVLTPWFWLLRKNRRVVLYDDNRIVLYDHLGRKKTESNLDEVRRVRTSVESNSDNPFVQLIFLEGAIDILGLEGYHELLERAETVIKSNPRPDYSL